MILISICLDCFKGLFAILRYGPQVRETKHLGQNIIICTSYMTHCSTGCFFATKNFYYESQQPNLDNNDPYK